MPSVTDSETRDRFNAFLQDYERRHGELISRVIRLETQYSTLATREDLIMLKEAVNTFRATVDQFEGATAAMATKTDVDWLKKAFWYLAGAVSSVGTALIVAFVLHVMGNP